jgi:aryl-alcohol dehydrogenase-like predicted oxidoreductase
MMLPNNIRKKIIIGTWSWSGQYKSVSNKTIEDVFNVCLDNKFMEFDTSSTYLGAEKILSEFKQENKNILINTKCGWNQNMEKNFDEKNLIYGLERALDLFKNINVMQLHNPRDEIKNWNKVIAVLQKYKKKGYIKSIGISLARNHYFSIKIMNKFDFIQDEFNLLRVEPYYKMKNFKKIFAARSPFANGILTTNFSSLSAFSKNDHRHSWLSGARLKTISQQKKILESLTNLKIETLATNFVLSFPFVDKAIFGIRTVKHLRDLLKNIEKFKKLKPSLIKKIIDLNANNELFCRNIYRYNN